MSLTISEKKESSVPLLEAGTYTAVCCELVDLGQQYNEKWGTSARKVLIGWEVVGETVNVNGEAQPRIFSKTYTASLNEKASLRKDLNAWRGRPFTDEELEHARRHCASSLRALTDSPGALEEFYLSQTLKGLDYGPEELAALCELVIEGIPTNIEEQLRIISGEKFMGGDYDLTLMEGR